MALVLANVLYVANAGDARAVICVKNQAVRLTYDHKPTDPEELERIRCLGGFVHNCRTNGLLAVSRALGDKDSQPYVTYSPYINKVSLGYVSVIALVSF